LREVENKKGGDAKTHPRGENEIGFGEPIFDYRWLWKDETLSESF